MKYFKKIVGKEVYLSPVSSEDLEQFVEWMNNFNLTDYIGRSDALVTIENEKEWIANATSGEKYIFSIVKMVRHDEDKLVGVIELMDINQTDRRATVGIFIGENSDRGRGIGTEALNLILEYAFNYLNMHSINLTVLAINERAKRCYEKVGFKVVGTQRECRFVAGKYRDVIHMDILASEFVGGFISNTNLEVRSTDMLAIIKNNNL